MSDPVSAAVAASAAASAASSVGFFASMGLMIASWSIVLLIAVVLLGILSEHNESRGWAIFFMLASAAIAFMTFSFSLMSLAIGAVAYLAIGLAWSFWRYKRHAQKVVADNKNENSTVKQRVLERLHPREMLGTITAWIMIWPFSMIGNLAGDLINFVQALVTKIFRGVYHKIYDSAVSALS